ERALDGIQGSESLRPSAQQTHQVRRYRLPKCEALVDFLRFEDGGGTLLIDVVRGVVSHGVRDEGRGELNHPRPRGIAPLLVEVDGEALRGLEQCREKKPNRASSEHVNSDWFSDGRGWGSRWRRHAAIYSRASIRNSSEFDMTTEQMVDHGATVVITHRVRQNKIGAYEEWLKEIAPLARAWPGCLDWNIVRPIPGLTATFTIILRFDSEANLRGWIESPARARLIKKAQPLFVKGDDFYISSGLDFW